ncbi:glycosyltransferase [Polaribacter sp. MSW13]|uniref:Glycosyltransferase n=1 Tax=Polaribacter marinus TaxID=2916838 RepID=A0A9X1VKY1_9FLAO|nr:glycosyltransferase [Polaribacter marinus]MCI2228399.1 glycosyltransferase [Polaribacter marinus]
MNKKGIIQVIDSLNAGGAEVLSVNIANALFERGFNSHICTTRKEGILKNNVNKEVGYLFLKKNKTIDFKSIIRFKKYIKKNKIDIIHAHSTSYFFAFLIKLIVPRVRLIWHDHFGISQDLSNKKTFPLNICSLFFEAIISVNSELKKWAESNLLTKKVFFLNNFPMFVNSSKTTVLFGETERRIVHLAGFKQVKDHKNLIKAFHFLHKEHKNWTLHLVGKLYKNNYTKEIISYIELNQLEKHIFVYNECLDIQNILNQSTIGVLSSKSEGLPVSLLEYGLAKLPVIVTNVGECEKVIEEGVSGFLVEKENSKEFYKAMKVLVTSEEKRFFFGKNHSKIVLENYSRDSFINTLLKIYQIN